MIGGADFTMRTVSGPPALDFCIRMVRLEWPNAVFEDLTEQIPVSNYGDLSIASLKELLIFRDAQAADDWRCLGATSSNQNTMIHILISPFDLTVVVDDPRDAVMNRILTAVRSGLERDILMMRAAA